MGAANFETIGLGKDLRSAFNSAVESAQWEYGHGGYSGTIAEKHSVTSAGKLQRVSPRKFVDTISSIVDEFDVEEQYDKKLGRYVSKRTNARTKAIARLPESLKALDWNTIAAAYDDKWGPAAAVEITGKAASEIKARHGRKGTRDRVFLFVGMASS